MKVKRIDHSDILRFDDEEFTGGISSDILYFDEKGFDVDSKLTDAQFTDATHVHYANSLENKLAYCGWSK